MRLHTSRPHCEVMLEPSAKMATKDSFDTSMQWWRPALDTQ